jgi:predicted metal-dependent hydrolase
LERGSHLEIELDGQTIYVKRKHGARCMRAHVHLNSEVIVTAPKLASNDQIAEFIQKNSNWIEKQLVRGATLRKRFPQKLYRNGEIYPVFGAEVRLQFVKSADVRKPAGWVSAPLLILEVPHKKWNETYTTNPQPHAHEWLRAFYKAEAERLIGPRVQLWASRTQLFPSEVSFRGQTSLWGSCSPQKKLSLNWKLVAAPLAVIDYVIIHELCHLRHMNHSQNFWNLVETHCSNFREARQWLREHLMAFDFLNKRSVLFDSNLEF